MSLTICCARPTGIASAVKVLNPCPEDLGQIQKMVFWRTGNSTVATSLVSSTAWATLLAATDDTKAIVTPFLGAVTIPPNEAREFGGGNETRFGSPIRKGGASVPVTANMYEEAQSSVIAALKELRCETLEVLFINEANQIIYSTASTVSGFPVCANSLFVSDKGIGGLDDADHNVLMFNLRPNWSDTLAVSAETTFALEMINA